MTTFDKAAKDQRAISPITDPITQCLDEAVARMDASGLNYLYRPLLRPPSHCTLPDAIAWDYVEAPARDIGVNRTDLPRSQHAYGVIALSRRLTHDEASHFGLLWQGERT